MVLLINYNRVNLVTKLKFFMTKIKYQLEVVYYFLKYLKYFNVKDRQMASDCCSAYGKGLFLH